MEGKRTTRTLEPIARLKATSGVSGLCFLSNNTLPTSPCSVRSSVNKEVDEADEELSAGDRTRDHDDESSSSDEDEELPFQCRSMIHNHKHNGGLATFLATCHNSGPAMVWDLRHQKVVYEFGHDRAGPGLALRRISDESSSSSSRVLYQTRDPQGTVSLHDLIVTNSGDINARRAAGTAAIVKMETYSQTFCAASPCVGDANLVALPSHDAGFATIRDWRISPTHRPVAYMHGAAGCTLAANGDAVMGGSGGTKKHGMLTSLAMLCGQSSLAGSAAVPSSEKDDLLQTMTSTCCSRPILACGMEDGSIFFHDLAMTGGSGKNDNNKSSSIPHCPSSSSPLELDHANTLASEMISLSSSTSTSDPVLTLDLALSATTARHHNDSKISFVAVAGLAGHAADLGDVPAEEQGRVAIIKGASSSSSSSSSPNHHEKRKLSLRLRARVGPNYYQNTSDVDCMISSRNIPTTTTTTPSAAGPGFAGISVCRWRPDGRIFAAGGWDKRVRIYDRAMAAPAVSNSSLNGTNSSSNSNTRTLAVLKGHEASVTTVDWAPDAKRSGLLATGATDGSVYIWSCFGVSN